MYAFLISKHSMVVIVFVIKKLVSHFVRVTFNGDA